MTFRRMTPEESDEIAALYEVERAAKNRIQTWLTADAARRSTLAPGDEAYCMETGALIGKIHELIGHDSYSWERPPFGESCKIIDNNSHSYGKPRLGTKAEAAEGIRLQAKSLLWHARALNGEQ